MNVQIDTSAWTDMVKELTRLSGADFFDVLIGQVGAVMKRCIDGTPARSVAQIVRRVSDHATFIEFADGTIINRWKNVGDLEVFFEESTYPEMAARWPKQSPVPNMKGGKSWHNMDGKHWSDRRWASYQERLAKKPEILKQMIEGKLAARGLAKKSWWQVAEDLGLNPGLAAGWVRNAHGVAANGDLRDFKEGFATKLIENAAAIVEVRIDNPLLVGRLNGEAILDRAMAAQLADFEKDMESGLLDTLTARAKKYPGIFFTS